MNQCSPLNLLLRIVARLELSPVKNCRLLRIVACYELSPHAHEHQYYGAKFGLQG